MTNQEDGHIGAGNGHTARILLFFDYACPFCYVDQFRFDRLRATEPVDIMLVPFELRPDMSEAGISARAEGLAHSEHVDEHLYAIAREEGAPFTLPDLIPYTHRALIVGELARAASEETHRAVHHAIFGAYFGKGLDIGSREVLLQLAEEQGLGRGVVESAWEDEKYEERLHQFRHVALGMGVDATPAAVICNELIIGSRPYEVFKAAVDRCLFTADSLESEGEA